VMTTHAALRLLCACGLIAAIWLAVAWALT
jgi:hypothetical protein